jgi:spore coat protein U-like protein
MKSPSKWLVLMMLAPLLPFGAATAACELEVQPVLFGSYDALTGNPVNGVGQVLVQCTPATDYVLSLTPGQGSYDRRELHSEQAAISYNLYLDPAHARIWGDGSSGTETAIGNGEDARHTIYGRIDANQRKVPAGDYFDQILVTVNF